MPRVDRMIRRYGIKKQLVVMNEAYYRMFQRGMEMGAASALARIAASTAGLDYGPGYVVQRAEGVQDEVNAQMVRDYNVDHESESTLGSVVPPVFPEEYVGAIHASGHDPEAGSFPSS